MRARFLVISAALISAPACLADSFRSVAYDSASDEIVIEVDYRGTNPKHEFTLQWGACVVADDGSKKLSGDLLDQQFEDPAQRDYHRTLRFSVADLDCRPSTATLRTAPRFLITVQLPVRTAASP